MTRFHRLVAVVFTFVLFAAPLFAQPRPDDEWVAIDQLPPGEQLPAAPFLVAAYAFVWLAAMFYLWTIWRRMQKVEHEMQTLTERQGQGSRSH